MFTHDFIYCYLKTSTSSEIIEFFREPSMINGSSKVNRPKLFPCLSSGFSYFFLPFLFFFLPCFVFSASLLYFFMPFSEEWPAVGCASWELLCFHSLDYLDGTALSGESWSTNRRSCLLHPSESSSQVPSRRFPPACVCLHRCGDEEELVLWRW